MALRSVVLEPPAPPPAPRRSVVVRTGGPQPKGRRADLLTCLLGAVLLIGSIVLVQVLPEKDYVNPRYKVSYPLGGGERFSQFADLDEATNTSHAFMVEIPNDNVIVVTLQVGFADDIPASKPDVFRVTLLDPDGNQIGQPSLVESPPPTGKPSAQPADGGYSFDPHYFQLLMTFSIAPSPQEEIVEGASRHETQKEALDRLEPLTHVRTMGLWTVKVELLEAGDCPEPGDDPFDPAQAYACVRDQAGGPDPRSTSTQDRGNDFTLEFLQWTYYATCTETVQVVDPKPLPDCR